MLSLRFSFLLAVSSSVLLHHGLGFLHHVPTSRTAGSRHWMTEASQADSTPTTSEEEEKKVLLLDRLGGQPALEAAVNIFYDRVVADPELERFFEGTDMEALRAHQYRFMEIAFTEIPEDLDVVAYISNAHGRLLKQEGLNEHHFDLVAGHLVGTLQGLGVQQAEIDDVVATVGPLRGVFEQAAEEAASAEEEEEEEEEK